MATRFPLVLLTLAWFVAVGCNSEDSRPSALDVDDNGLRNADADSGNWLMYGRTYGEQRFSPLGDIDEENVGQLGLVWSLEFDTTRGLEATPLVVDGVIYTTGVWSVVYAVDAATGTMIWTYNPEVSKSRAAWFLCCDAVNRGLALYRGKLYVGTIDGRLVALDARSGRPVWETVTVDQSKPYSITGAPRIAKGMVLIGNGGAEFGVRGYVSAYDAETGTLAWRTYTVPGNPALGFESAAMERAAATWQGEWWVAGGGGTAWDSMVYDPELDLVFVGTGNGSPWYRDLRSPGGGDNLYLASILALRADDGELVWYYQTNPGDNWDYTAVQPLMLAELQIDGRARSVIMQAPKNGFFYVLDRETGELISAKAFVNTTWATGIDRDTGRPIEAPTAYAGTGAVLVWPAPHGAHNWHPMAYHPDTGYVYFAAKDASTSLHAPDPGWKYDPRWSNRGADSRYRGPLWQQWLTAPPPVGRLLAWDPVRQRPAWQVDHPVQESGGVLATAGNLVFQGRSDGMFIAYRATDGSRLWEFDAGTGIMAPPVTYLVGGQQYLTVMAGWGGATGVRNPPTAGPVKPGWGRILTFAIGGTATLEITPYGHSVPPRPAIDIDAPAVTLEEGSLLYSRYCQSCHGTDVISGPISDLRYSTRAVHEQFERIVLGGLQENLGMPSFAELMTPDQVRAIQAYVLSRAAAATAGPP